MLGATDGERIVRLVAHHVGAEAESHSRSHRRGLLLAFDESIAPVQKIDIILDRRVIRFALESFLEFFPRCGQFAAQHIGITLVIENLRGFSNKLNGLPIRSVCQIEPPEMVIGGCKSDPCFWVLRGFFDRILKIPLRCSVNPAIEIFLAQVQWFVRRVVFYVPGSLDRQGG